MPTGKPVGFPAESFMTKLSDSLIPTGKSVGLYNNPE